MTSSYRRRGLAESLLLSRSRRLLLDTNVFIYFLTGLEPYFALLLPVFRRIQRGELRVVVSALTEAELLVRPQREQDEEAIERIEDLLSEDGFQVTPVDRPTARLAARLRALYGLALADAIIVATAAATRCEGVVSNDGKWRRVTEIPIINLDELITNG